MELATSNDSRVVRGLEGLLEICASLKLAIALLLALAAYLGAATFYEARYGAQATQAMVYGSRVFVSLLALLAIVIMAAVIVRFPWKRRQTGFIITHIGLEVMLAGCLLSYYRSVDGRVAIAEGASTDSVSLLSEQIQVLVPGEQGASIRMNLWNEAGYPTLGRFVLGLVKPLPEEPKWPAGHTVDHPLPGGGRLEVLDWLPVAKADVDGAPHVDAGRVFFRPARVAPDKMSEALRAVKVALSIDGERSERWLGRGMMPASVAAGGGTYTLAYGFDAMRLPFTLNVLDFDKINNPGANTPAAFVSRVQVTHPGGGIEEHAITLNEPMTVGGLTFYQAGYDDTVTPPVTVLSVRRDPGTLLKYGGSILIVSGIFTMFYMRAYFQTSVSLPKAPAAHPSAPPQVIEKPGAGQCAVISSQS